MSLILQSCFFDQSGCYNTSTRYFSCNFFIACHRRAVIRTSRRIVDIIVTKTTQHSEQKSRCCFKGQITISSDPSPLVGIQFLAIPFAFDFAFKMHIKEKSFKHSK